MNEKMKKWFFPLAIIIGIIFSCIYAKGENADSYIYGAILPWNLEDLLKRVFLYITAEDFQFSDVSMVSYTNYTGIICFSICHISMSLYGISKKHRSLLMLRYKDKSSYVKHNQKQGVIYCAQVIIAVVIGVVAGFIITGCKGAGAGQIGALIFLLANIFIFLNIIVILNIYFTLTFGDMLSLGLLLIIGMATVFLERKVSLITVTTYESILNLMWATGGLTCVYLILNYLIHRGIKHMDLL